MTNLLISRTASHILSIFLKSRDLKVPHSLILILRQNEKKKEEEEEFHHPTECRHLRFKDLKLGQITT